ncbi:MAG: hypothetical protein LBT00_00990 [Spirochaetaceae bacterium]|nr:hypothetical protein [Spirochaetaceae bacterium]
MENAVFWTLRVPFLSLSILNYPFFTFALRCILPPLFLPGLSSQDFSSIDGDLLV